MSIILPDDAGLLEFVAIIREYTKYSHYSEPEFTTAVSWDGRKPTPEDLYRLEVTIRRNYDRLERKVLGFINNLV